MSSIGSLVVDIRTNSAKFVEGMNSVNDRMSKFESKVMSAQKALGVLAGAASVIALKNMAESAIQNADALQKMADKIGLSSEKLQEWRHGADLAGVGADTFDKSISKLSQKIGEAVTKGGEAKKTFDDLGISLYDSEGKIKSLETIFYQVSDAIKNTDDSNERLSQTMRLFGEEGGKMVTFLKMGQEEIKKFEQDARDLGLVIEEGMLRNAEKANDQLSIMSRVLSTQLTKAVLEFTPEIQTLTGAFIDAIKWAGELLRSYSRIANAGELERLYKEQTRLQQGLWGAQKLLADGTENAFYTNISTELDSVNSKIDELENRLAMGGSPLKVGIDKGVKELPVAAVSVNPIFDEDILAGSFDARIEYLREHNALVESIIGEHHERVKAFEIDQLHSRLNSTASILGSLSQLVAGESFKSFNAAKNLAYAETIISTYAAAQLAFQNTLKIPGVGVATAWAAAGAAVAAGLARAKAIHSTSFNGGSSSSAGGGAPSFSAAPVTGFPTRQETQQQTPINIYLGDELLATVVAKGTKLASDNDQLIFQDAETFNRVRVK